MRYATLVLLLVACSSDPDPFTWGDAAERFAGAVCAAYEDPCGFKLSGPDPQEVCKEHLVFHLCQADRSCDTPALPGAEDYLDGCDKALKAMDDDACYYFGFWGFVPAECDIWQFEPEPEE